MSCIIVRRLSSENKSLFDVKFVNYLYDLKYAKCYTIQKKYVFYVR